MLVAEENAKMRTSKMKPCRLHNKILTVDEQQNKHEYF